MTRTQDNEKNVYLCLSIDFSRKIEKINIAI